MSELVGHHEQDQVDNNPVYQWFIDEIGGEDKLIPLNHILPLVLRIHYRQIMDSFGLKAELSKDTSPNVAKVDEHFGFTDESVRSYKIGNSPTSNTIKARQLFIDNAFRPSTINAILGEEVEYQTELTECDAQNAPRVDLFIDRAGGLMGVRRILAERYAKRVLEDEIAVNFSPQ